MIDKVLDIPLDGLPAARFPEMEREVYGGGMRFILLPPGKVAAFLKTEVAIIDVNLNPVEQLWSWNSDKLEMAAVSGDSIAYIPFRGEFRIVAENFLPGLIIELEDRYSIDLFDQELGITDASVDYLSYQHDPVGADLGRAAIQLLMEDHRTGERADSLALESIGTALVARIAKRLSDDRSIKSPRPSRAAIGRDRLAAVTEYIETNLASGISLIELAAIAVMSVSHFGRSFKLATGVSPLRYVMIRRVARAKLMLTQPKLSVAQTAFACGFSGQTHLTRVFKEMTGTTPAVFRRNSGT